MKNLDAAFPSMSVINDEGLTVVPRQAGLSKREYIAVKILAAMYANGLPYKTDQYDGAGRRVEDRRESARQEWIYEAVKSADALLRELSVSKYD